MVIWAQLQLCWGLVDLPSVAAAVLREGVCLDERGQALKQACNCASHVLVAVAADAESASVAAYSNSYAAVSAHASDDYLHLAHDAATLVRLCPDSERGAACSAACSAAAAPP